MALLSVDLLCSGIVEDFRKIRDGDFCRFQLGEIKKMCTRRWFASAVVVSESSVVRILDDGEIITVRIPKLWRLRHYEPYATRRDKQLTFFSKKDFFMMPIEAH
jgi:hypothetical protein